MTVVLAIFCGVYNLLDCFDPEEEEIIGPVLLKNWENIAHWIRRFCETFKSKEIPFPGETLGVAYDEWYRRLVCTLTCIAMRRDMEWTKQMWAVPDARIALYHLWFLDDPSTDPLNRELSAKCTRGLTAVLQHAKVGALPGVDVAAELIQACPNGKEGIARIAVSRLLAGLKDGDNDDTCEFAHTVLSLMVLCNNRPLTIALLEKRAVVYTTQMFVKLARIRLESRGMGKAPLDIGFLEGTRIIFISNFLGELDFLSSFGTGCPHIREALQNDLMRGIVACMADLTSFSPVRQKITRALSFFLGNTIPAHLAYYSVILALQTAMESVDEGEVERWVLTSSIRSDWIKLQRCLLERMVCKAQYLKAMAPEIGTATCGQVCLTELHINRLNLNGIHFSVPKNRR